MQNANLDKEIIFKQVDLGIGIIVLLACLLGLRCKSSQPDRLRHHGIYVTEKVEFMDAYARHVICFYPDSTTAHAYLEMPLRQVVSHYRHGNASKDFFESGIYSLRRDSIFVHSKIDQLTGISHSISPGGEAIQRRHQDTLSWEGKLDGKYITFEIYSQKQDTTYLQTYRFVHF